MSGRAADPPRSYFPYFLIGALTLLLMAAAHIVRLPIPEAATMVGEARVSFNGGPEEVVDLPHRWPPLPGSVEATYRLRIDLPETEEGFLLIPAAQHALAATLGGVRVTGTEIYIVGEPSIGAPYMLEIPDGPEGVAELVVTLTRRNGMIPGYLSPIYAVEASAMAGARAPWVFVTRGTRVSVIGLQGIVLLALATVWLARRKDPIFGWLFLLGIGSLVYSVFNSPDGGIIPADEQPYLTFLMPALGLMALGLARAIVDKPRPAWLKIGIVALPASLVAGMASGLLPSVLALLLATGMAIGGHVVAAAMLARDALRRDEWDRALLAVPFFLVGWYGLRDLGIVTGLVDGALLLSAKIRLITILAVITLLMRRLVSSLDAVDRSNETLRLRLAAQEQELSQLHAKEKALTAQTIREQERARLTRDLHDGLSGHLVSIIALSQEDSADHRSIERAARGALDDLRMVINSLDIEDGDLLPALAGLRERLEPQLRRLGMDLDWSMESLPEASGFTSGGTLSILRIVQEAITNAIKHGRAGRITVHGSAGRGDTILLRIANDVQPDAVRGAGHGLTNMQRRAIELGGAVRFDIDGGRATLTLVLPSVLPGDAAP